jgi:hypothetical protein
MIAPPDSKGEEGPKSTKNPVSFAWLFQVTVVPLFTQNGELDLILGILGVIEAEAAVRFMSTVQGAEDDPHVLVALHMLCGSASEQEYLPFSCANEVQAKARIIEVTRPQRKRLSSRRFIRLPS